MKEQNLLAGINIIFESNVNEKDRNKAILENTYLFDRLAIENIEVSITLADGEIMKLNIMDWETNVDEEYFEDKDIIKGEK